MKVGSVAYLKEGDGNPDRGGREEDKTQQSPLHSRGLCLFIELDSNTKQHKL